MWLFAPGVFTHQEVSNETDDQDDGEDEKSHAKGYSQDSCPEEETKKSLFLRKLMSVAGTETVCSYRSRFYMDHFGNSQVISGPRINGQFNDLSLWNKLFQMTPSWFLCTDGAC